MKHTQHDFIGTYRTSPARRGRHHVSEGPGIAPHLHGLSATPQPRPTSVIHRLTCQACAKLASHGEAPATRCNALVKSLQLKRFRGIAKSRTGTVWQAPCNPERKFGAVFQWACNGKACGYCVVACGWARKCRRRGLIIGGRCGWRGRVGQERVPLRQRFAFLRTACNCVISSGSALCTVSQTISRSMSK